MGKVSKFYARLRGVLLTLPILLLGSFVQAAPEGGRITKGDGRLSSSDTHTDIYQYSDFLATRWNSFNIATHESVQAHQPSSTARILIRVDGGGGTNIAGSYTSNGITILENQNGVQFSRGAVVNVGGLLATSSRISGADSARWQLNGTGGAVVNHGKITAGVGGAILAAVKVQNTGDITSKGGNVALGAGSSFTIDFAGSMVGFEVTSAASGASIVNTGKIESQGGIVELSAQEAQAVRTNVVSVGGIVKATKMERRGGVIYLSGGDEGIAEVSANVSASEKIQTTGKYIVVKENTLLKAPEILVGGDFQGKGDVPTAQRTLVEADALLDAGANGRVIVWSDETTWFNGDIIAPEGFAEVSGKKILASVNLAGIDMGEFGELLLDPEHINITNSAFFINAQVTGNVFANTPAPGGGTTLWLDAASVNRFKGNLSLEANDSLAVGFGVTINKPVGNLTLIAGGDIRISSSINNGTNTLTLIAGKRNSAGKLLTFSGTHTLTAGTVIINRQNGAFGANLQLRFNVQTLRLNTPANQTVHSWMVGENRSLILTSTNGAITVGGDIDIGSGSFTLDSRRGIVLSRTLTLNANRVSLKGAINASAAGYSLRITASNSITFNNDINLGQGLLSLLAGSGPVSASGIRTLTAQTVNIGQNGSFGANAPFIFSSSVQYLGLRTNVAQTIQGWMILDNRSLTLIASTITVSGNIATGTGRFTLSTDKGIILSGDTSLTGKNINLVGVVDGTSGDGHNFTITASEDISLTGNIDLAGSGVLTLTAGMGSSNGNISVFGRVRLNVKTAILSQDNAFGANVPFVFLSTVSALELKTNAAQTIRDWMVAPGRDLSLTSTRGRITIVNDVSSGVGNITLNGNRGIVLINNVTLAGSHITLTGAINGNKALTVNALSTLTLNSNINTGTANLSLNAAGLFVDTFIHLGRSITLTGGTITLTGAINESSAKNLTITARASININNDINLGTGVLKLSAGNGAAGDIVYPGTTNRTFTANKVEMRQDSEFPLDPPITLVTLQLILSNEADQRLSEWMFLRDRSLSFTTTGIIVLRGTPILGQGRLILKGARIRPSRNNIEIEAQSVSLTGVIEETSTNRGIIIRARTNITLNSNINLGTGTLDLNAGFNGNGNILNGGAARTLTAATVRLSQDAPFGSAAPFTFTTPNLFLTTHSPQTMQNWMAGNRSLSLTSTGAITIKDNIITGSGDITLLGASIVLIDDIQLSGRDVQITGAIDESNSTPNANGKGGRDSLFITASGNITLNSNIKLGTGRLDLNAGHNGNGNIINGGAAPTLAARIIYLAQDAPFGSSSPFTLEMLELLIFVSSPQTVQGWMFANHSLTLTSTGAITIENNIINSAVDLSLNGTSIDLSRDNLQITSNHVSLNGAIDESDNNYTFTITASGDITLHSDVDVGTSGVINLTANIAADGKAISGDTNITLTAATVNIKQNAAFDVDAPFTFTKSPLNLTTSAAQTVRAWMTSGNRPLTLTSTDVITVGANISTGTGALTLSGASISLSGAFEIAGSTIILSAINGFGNTLTIRAAAALTLNGNIDLSTSDMSSRGTLDIRVSRGKITTLNSSITLTAANVILEQKNSLPADLLSVISPSLSIITQASQSMHPWMYNTQAPNSIETLSITSTEGAINIPPILIAINDLTLSAKDGIKIRGTTTLSVKNIALLSNVSGSARNIVFHISSTGNPILKDITLTGDASVISISAPMTPISTATLSAERIVLSDRNSMPLGDMAPFIIEADELVLFSFSQDGGERSLEQKIYPWMLVKGRDLTINVSGCTGMAQCTVFIENDVKLVEGNLNLQGQHGIRFSSARRLEAHHVHLHHVIAPGHDLTIVAHGELLVENYINLGSGALVMTTEMGAANGNFFSFATDSTRPILTAGSISMTQNPAFRNFAALGGVRPDGTGFSTSENEALRNSVPFTLVTNNLILKTDTAQTFYPTWMLDTGNLNRSLSLTSLAAITINDDINTGTGDLTLIGDALTFSAARTLSGKTITLGEVSATNMNLTLNGSDDVTLLGDIELISGNLDITSTQGGIITASTRTINATSVKMTQTGLFPDEAFLFGVIVRSLHLITTNSGVQPVHQWMVDSDTRKFTFTASNAEMVFERNINTGANELNLSARLLNFKSGDEDESLTLEGIIIDLTGASKIKDGLQLHVTALSRLTLRQDFNAGSGTLDFAGYNIFFNSATPSQPLTFTASSIRLAQYQSLDQAPPLTLTTDRLILDIQQSQQIHAWMSEWLLTTNHSLSITSRRDITISKDVDLNVGVGDLSLTAAAINIEQIADDPATPDIQESRIISARQISLNGAVKIGTIDENGVFTAGSFSLTVNTVNDLRLAGSIDLCATLDPCTSTLNLKSDNNIRPNNTPNLETGSVFLQSRNALSPRAFRVTATSLSIITRNHQTLHTWMYAPSLALSVTSTNGEVRVPISTFFIRNLTLSAKRGIKINGPVTIHATDVNFLSDVSGEGVELTMFVRGKLSLKDITLLGTSSRINIFGAIMPNPTATVTVARVGIADTNGNAFNDQAPFIIKAAGLSLSGGPQFGNDQTPSFQQRIHPWMTADGRDLQIIISGCTGTSQCTIFIENDINLGVGDLNLQAQHGIRFSSARRLEAHHVNLYKVIAPGQDLTIVAHGELLVENSINLGSGALELTTEMGAANGDFFTFTTDNIRPILVASSISLTQNAAFRNFAALGGVRPDGTGFSTPANEALRNSVPFTLVTNNLILKTGAAQTFYPTWMLDTGNLNRSVSLTSLAAITINEDINTGTGDLALIGDALTFSAARTLGGKTITLGGVSVQNLNLTLTGSDDVTLLGDIDLGSGNLSISAGGENALGTIMTTGSTTQNDGDAPTITAQSVSLFSGDLLADNLVDLASSVSSLILKTNSASAQTVHDWMADGTNRGLVLIAPNAKLQIGRDIITGLKDLSLTAQNIDFIGPDTKRTLSGNTIEINLTSQDLRAATAQTDLALTLEATYLMTLNRGFDVGGGALDLSAASLASNTEVKLTAASVRIAQNDPFSAEAKFTFITSALTLETQAAQSLQPWMFDDMERNLTLNVGGSLIVDHDIRLTADLILEGAAIIFEGERTLSANTITLTAARKTMSDPVTAAITPSASDANLFLISQRDLKIAAAINIGTGTLRLVAGSSQSETGIIIFDGNPDIISAHATLSQDGNFFIRDPAPARFINAAGETVRPEGFYYGNLFNNILTVDFSDYLWISINQDSFFFERTAGDDDPNLQVPQNIDVSGRIILNAPLGTITFDGDGAIWLRAPTIAINARQIDPKGRALTIQAYGGMLRLNTNIINGGSLSLSAINIAFAGDVARHVSGTVIDITSINTISSQQAVHLTADGVLTIAANFDLPHDLILQAGTINFSTDRVISLKAVNISLTASHAPTASNQNLTIDAKGHLDIKSGINVGTAALVLSEVLNQISFSSSRLIAAQLTLTQRGTFTSIAPSFEESTLDALILINASTDIQEIHPWMIAADRDLTIRSGGNLVILAPINLGTGNLILNASYGQESTDGRILFANKNAATIEAGQITLKADGALTLTGASLTFTSLGDLYIGADINVFLGSVVLTAGARDNVGAINFSTDQAIEIRGDNITLTADAPSLGSDQDLTLIAKATLVIDSDLLISSGRKGHLFIDLGTSLLNDAATFLNQPTLTAPLITFISKDSFGPMPSPRLFTLAANSLTLINMSGTPQRLRPWMVEAGRSLTLRTGGMLLAEGDHDFGTGDLILHADGQIRFTAAIKLQAGNITLNSGRLPANPVNANISVIAKGTLLLDVSLDAGSGDIQLTALTGAINFSILKRVRLEGHNISLTAGAAPRASDQILHILPTGTLIIGASIDVGVGDLTLGLRDITSSLTFTRDVELQGRYIILSSISEISTGGTDLTIRARTRLDNVNHKNINVGEGSLVLSQGTGALSFGPEQMITAASITLEQQTPFGKTAPVQMMFTGDNPTLALSLLGIRIQGVHGWMVVKNRNLTIHAGQNIRIAGSLATLDLGTGRLELKAALISSEGQIRFASRDATLIKAAQITLSAGDQVVPRTQDITLMATGALLVNMQINTTGALTLTGNTVSFGSLVETQPTTLILEGAKITITANEMAMTANNRSVIIRSGGVLNIAGSLDVDRGDLHLIAGHLTQSDAIHFMTRNITLSGSNITLSAPALSTGDGHSLTVIAQRHIYMQTSLALGLGDLTLSAAISDITGAIIFSSPSNITLSGKNISLSGTASLPLPIDKNLTIIALRDLTINSSINTGRGQLLLIAGRQTGAGVGRLSFATTSPVELRGSHIQLEGQEAPLTGGAHDFSIRASKNIDIFTDLTLGRDGESALFLEAGFGNEIGSIGTVRIFGTRTFTADQIIIRQDGAAFGPLPLVDFVADGLRLRSFSTQSQPYYFWNIVPDLFFSLRTESDIILNEDIHLGTGDLLLKVGKSSRFILPSRAFTLSGKNVALVSVQEITTNGHALTIIASDKLRIAADINTGSGDLVLSGRTVSFGNPVANTVLDLRGANIRITAASVPTVSLNRDVHIIATGNLEINGGFNAGTGNLTLIAGGGPNAGALQFGASTKLQGNDITLGADLAPQASHGDITIIADGNLYIQTDIHAGSHDLTLTAVSGAVHFRADAQIKGAVITLTASTKPTGDNQDITLHALRELNINASINVGSGNLTLIAGVGHTINFSHALGVTLTGDTITLTAGAAFLRSGPSLKLDARLNIQINSDIDAGSGTLSLTSKEGAINFDTAHAISLDGFDISLTAAKAPEASDQHLTIIAARHISIHTDINTGLGILTLIASGSDRSGAINFNPSRATTLSGRVINLTAAQSSGNDQNQSLTLNALGDLTINTDLDIGAGTLILSAGEEIIFPRRFTAQKISITKGASPFTRTPPVNFVGVTEQFINYTGTASQTLYHWMVINSSQTMIHVGGVLVIDNDINAGLMTLSLTATGGIHFIGDVEIRGNGITLNSLAAPLPSNGDLIVYAAGDVALTGRFDAGSGQIRLEAGLGEEQGAINFGTEGITKLKATDIILIADATPTKSNQHLTITAARNINIHTNIDTGTGNLFVKAAASDETGALSFNPRQASILSGGNITLSAVIPGVSRQNLTLVASGNVDLDMIINLGDSIFRVEAAGNMTFSGRSVVRAGQIYLRQDAVFGIQNPLQVAELSASRVELISTNSAPQTFGGIIPDESYTLVIRVGGDLNIEGNIGTAEITKRLIMEAGYDAGQGAINFIADAALKAIGIILIADKTPTADNNVNVELIASRNIYIATDINTGSGNLTIKAGSARAGAIRFHPERATALTGGEISLTANSTPLASGQNLTITAQDRLTLDADLNVSDQARLILISRAAAISFVGEHRLVAHEISFRQGSEVFGESNPFSVDGITEITLDVSMVDFAYTGIAKEQNIYSWMIDHAQPDHISIRSTGNLIATRNLIFRDKDITLEAGFGPDSTGELLFSSASRETGQILEGRHITLISDPPTITEETLPNIGNLFVHAGGDLTLRGRFHAHKNLSLSAGFETGEGQIHFLSGAPTTLQGEAVLLFADKAPTQISGENLIIRASKSLYIEADINIGLGNLTLTASEGAINFARQRAVMLNGGDITLTASLSPIVSNHGLSLIASGNLVINAAITLNTENRLWLQTTGSGTISGNGSAVLSAGRIYLSQAAPFSEQNPLSNITFAADLVEFASPNALTVRPWMIGSLIGNAHLNIKTQDNLIVNLDINLGAERDLSLQGDVGINFNSTSSLRAQNITITSGSVRTQSDQSLTIAARDVLKIHANINTGEGALTLTARQINFNLTRSTTLIGGVITMTSAQAPVETSGQALTITASGNLDLGGFLNIGEGALTLTAKTINFISAQEIRAGTISLTASTAPTPGSHTVRLFAQGDINLGADINIGSGGLVLSAAKGAINFVAHVNLNAKRIRLEADRAPAGEHNFDVMITTTKNIYISTDLNVGTGKLTLSTAGALTFFAPRALSLAGGTISISAASSNDNSQDLTLTAIGGLTITAPLKTSNNLQLISQTGTITTTKNLSGRNIELSQGQVFSLENPFIGLEMTTERLSFISTSTQTQTVHSWMVNLATRNLVVRSGGDLIVDQNINMASRNLVLEAGYGAGAGAIDFSPTNNIELRGLLIFLLADQDVSEDVERQDLTIIANRLRLNTNINLGEGVLTIDVRDTLILSQGNGARQFAAGSISLSAGQVRSSEKRDFTLRSRSDLMVATPINLGAGNLFLEAGHAANVGVITFLSNDLKLTAANITLKQSGAPFGGIGNAPADLQYAQGLIIHYTGTIEQESQPWMLQAIVGKNFNLISEGSLLINRDIDLGAGNLVLTANGGAINFASEQITLNAHNITLTSSQAPQTSGDINTDLTVRASGDINVAADINVGTGVLTINADGNILSDGSKTLTAAALHLTQSDAFVENAPFILNIEELNIKISVSQALQNWMLGDMALNLMSAGDVDISGSHDFGAHDLVITAGGAINFSDMATVELTAANITLEAKDESTASNQDIVLTASGDLNINTNLNAGSGLLTLTGGIIQFSTARPTSMSGKVITLTSNDEDQTPTASDQSLYIDTTMLLMTGSTVIDIGNGLMTIDAQTNPMLALGNLRALRFDINFACSAGNCQTN